MCILGFSALNKIVNKQKIPRNFNLEHPNHVYPSSVLLLSSSLLLFLHLFLVVLGFFSFCICTQGESEGNGGVSVVRGVRGMRGMRGMKGVRGVRGKRGMRGVRGVRSVPGVINRDVKSNPPVFFFSLCSSSVLLSPFFLSSLPLAVSSSLQPFLFNFRFFTLFFSPCSLTSCPSAQCAVLLLHFLHCFHIFTLFSSITSPFHVTLFSSPHSFRHSLHFTLFYIRISLLLTLSSSSLSPVHSPQ